MGYEDKQYEKLNIWISNSSLEQLNNSNYKDELYEKIQIDVPKLNNVSITKTESLYNELPNHSFDKAINSKGVVELYTFEIGINDYENKLVEIQTQYWNILKSIKPYYTPFNINIDLGTVNNKGVFSFTLRNWNQLSETDFNKELIDVFGKINFTIKGVDDVLNSRSNFDKAFKMYSVPRIRHLKKK